MCFVFIAILKLPSADLAKTKVQDFVYLMKVLFKVKQCLFSRLFFWKIIICVFFELTFKAQLWLNCSRMFSLCFEHLWLVKTE